MFFQNVKKCPIQGSIWFKLVPRLFLIRTLSKVGLRKFCEVMLLVVICNLHNRAKDLMGGYWSPRNVFA
jgi:hypothetical protein